MLMLLPKSGRQSLRSYCNTCDDTIADLFTDQSLTRCATLFNIRGNENCAQMCRDRLPCVFVHLCFPCQV